MSFRIGDIEAGKGEKATGYVKLAEQAIGDVVAPMTIINGERGGARLLVEAGIHGTEYPGIKAAQMIARDIDPNRLSGTLMILHCANMPMFNAKTAFVNPIDDININRIFPGQPVSPIYYGPGTVSHHMVNNIFEKVMKRATHFVDLHGGDLPELCPCFAVSTKTGDPAKDVDAAAMLRYSLADFVTLREPNQALTTTGATSRAGIPNMLIESGGGGILTPENTKRHIDAVLNVMRYLKMIGEKPAEPSNQIHLSGNSIGIRARRGGFFTYLAGAGELVSKNQLIGQITDPFGVVVEEVRAPITVSSI